MKKNSGRMVAVLGAQYGSEGKGVIVASMANDFGVHVRVGSPNAGHTFRWKGEKHVMQSIPCGWTNPNAQIVIGRGALISKEPLLRELEHIERYYPNFRERLHIDPKAGVLDERFHLEEGGVEGEAHRRIGSTGEGVGPARAARIGRRPEEFRLFESVAEEWGLRECISENTPQKILKWKSLGENVLLEGTQGSALSLLHSYWPYCTSIDTNAAAILSEIGLPPAALDSVVLVARTFPIRVAGNSGPMKGELSWEELSARTGRPVEERTTVTRKVRRVGEWDPELLRSAVHFNAPTSFAFTFLDYLDPEVEGSSSYREILQSEACLDFLVDIMTEYPGVPISMLGTGGPDFEVIHLTQIPEGL